MHRQHIASTFNDIGISREVIIGSHYIKGRLFVFQMFRLTKFASMLLYHKTLFKSSFPKSRTWKQQTSVHGIVEYFFKSLPI